MLGPPQDVWRIAQLFVLFTPQGSLTHPSHHLWPVRLWHIAKCILLSCISIFNGTFRLLYTTFPFEMGERPWCLFFSGIKRLHTLVLSMFFYCQQVSGIRLQNPDEVIQNPHSLPYNLVLHLSWHLLEMPRGLSCKSFGLGPDWGDFGRGFWISFVNWCWTL